MTMCNGKGVVCCDKPTDNYHNAHVNPLYLHKMRSWLQKIQVFPSVVETKPELKAE